MDIESNDSTNNTVWTFQQQLDYSLNFIRVTVGLSILVLYIIAGCYLKSRKAKFGTCIYQVLHLFFVFFLAIACSIIPTIGELLIGNEKKEGVVAVIQTINCYIQFCLSLFLYISNLCIGAIVGSCTWICFQLVHQRAVSRPILMNACCIIIPWLVSVIFFSLEASTAELRLNSGSCLIPELANRGVIIIGPSVLIIYLVCALICGIFMWQYSIKQLKKFATLQSHIPLSTRMELHQINKVLVLLISGAVVQIVPVIVLAILFIVFFGITGEQIDSKEFLNMSQLIGVISTAWYPTYSLWRTRKIEQKEVIVNEEKRAKRLLEAQRKIQWKLEPRSGHAKHKPRFINVTPLDQTVEFCNTVQQPHVIGSLVGLNPKSKSILENNLSGSKKTIIKAEVHSSAAKPHHLPPIENPVTNSLILGPNFLSKPLPEIGNEPSND